MPAGSLTPQRTRRSKTPRRRSAKARAADRERCRRLLDTTIEFVDSEQFREEDAAERILAPLDDPEVERRRKSLTKPPADAPAFVAALYRVPLLTKSQEVHLFRKMNFLKYRADRLRGELDPDNPCVATMDRIETKLADANAIRNHVVRANLRLVFSLAKDLVDPVNGFDELVSDGVPPLIRAVELFDFERGTRFSTYATWAVRNSLHRVVPRNRRRRQRFAPVPEATFGGLADDRPSLESEEIRLASTRTMVEELVDGLEDDRDRVIVNARFGLGGEERPHRFREIAERLGISTERVRQLLARSLERMRETADVDAYESIDLV